MNGASMPKAAGRYLAGENGSYIEGEPPNGASS